VPGERGGEGRVLEDDERSRSGDGGVCDSEDARGDPRATGVGDYEVD